MQIDISKLINGYVEEIKVNEEIKLDDNLLKDNNIYSIHDLIFNGSISLNEEDKLFISGNISGYLVMPDDLTLESTDVKINTDIEEIIEKNEKILDISEILWQNILMEIPSMVRSHREEVNISGNGWRVISESIYEKEHSANNNPFKDLKDILDKKEGE